MTAFIIWVMIGCLFVGFGIFTMLSKKEVAFGFWANAKQFPVNNVKAYNRAVGILWCAYGIILAVLGLPLLGGQNSAGIIITILGVMAESIIAMVIYVTVIEKKYRKKS